MNVTKISAIAEIVSSVAIVVTLIYLTIETRQNTDALLATSRQATLDADLSFISNVIDHPELGIGRGVPGETAEEVRIMAHLIAYLRIREFAWFQYQNGILDETTWQSYMAPTPLVFALPESRKLLDGYRGDPEFIAYLREMLEDGSQEP